MENLLDECRAIFKPTPRKFGFLERKGYLNIYEGNGAEEQGDDLYLLFDQLPRLFAQGWIVWGQVVQANSLLFSKGKESCPGALVYSLQNTAELTTEYLEELAHQLFSLKGSVPTDPKLAPIAHFLTDEMERGYGLKVPSSLSPSIECYVTTTFFVRRHLPKGILHKSLLPIVVDPQDPRWAMPLPERYWSRKLKAQWRS